MQINTVNKTTLLIINPLICFGSLLSHPQKQYDVVITIFFYELIHFSEPLPPINRNNIKINCNNNLKCIKIIKR